MIEDGSDDEGGAEEFEHQPQLSPHRLWGDPVQNQMRLLMKQ